MRTGKPRILQGDSGFIATAPADLLSAPPISAKICAGARGLVACRSTDPRFRLQRQSLSAADQVPQPSRKSMHRAVCIMLPESRRVLSPSSECTTADQRACENGNHACCSSRNSRRGRLQTFPRRVHLTDSRGCRMVTDCAAKRRRRGRWNLELRSLPAVQTTHWAEVAARGRAL